jgi:tetratricopeptide (TPR) repeat protein
LLGAFEQLNQLSTAQRSTLFADLVANPNDFRYVAEHAWFEEHKRNTLLWQPCAEAYSRMATLALAWGYPKLALHCHVARAIMLDEYARDSMAAERALQEAVALLGEDAVLSRARARILYRRKDYASALVLMRAAKNEAGQQTIAKGDPIERAYMFREAGISAGELGDWADARNWFAAARDAASRARAPAMQIMTIGLHADEALAAAKAGDLGFAVTTMHEVVGELSSLDASSSVVAGYCHRVVRHGILWLFGIRTREVVEVEEQPARMVAGMCSNPEPTDMSAIPLGSIHYALYLLAQSAVGAAIPREVENRIVASLAGHTIPEMELALRHSRLAGAIEARDASEAVRLITAWVEVKVFMQSHLEVMRRVDMITPIYVEIPAITETDKAGESAAVAVNDVVLAFGAMCAIAADPDAIARLREGVYEFSQNVEVRHKLDVMVGAVTERGSESQRISYAARNAELTPDELFVVSLSLVRVVARSDFKGVLSQNMAAWSRRKWEHAISQQTFLMSNPRVNLPAIQLVLGEALQDLGFVGRLLLAAEPAVSTQLDKGYRGFLASLVGAHG